MRKADDLADRRQSGEASDAYDRLGWSERSRAPIAADKALRMIPRRSLIVYATAAILIGPSSARAQVSLGAERFIRSLGDRTLGVLNRSSTDQAALIQGMAEILGQAVDLATVARLALGRNWPRASHTQQQEYIGLFRAYTLGTLAQRFSQYVGTEHFVVTGSRLTGNGDAMVSTRIVYTDYPPLSIDWRVRDGGKNPTIVDVVVEGVSLILTSRAEFDSIVSQRGLEGLLEDMRARVERFDLKISGAGD